MKNHLSRLNAPKNWPISRKMYKWVAKPSPGSYKIKESMPLYLFLKVLGHAKTTREAKKILNDKKVLIDKKVRTDYKFPLGLMNVVEIPKINAYYRILIDHKGKFLIKEISKEEANIKLYKIIGKKLLKGKRVQINFFDGTNILLKKDEYHVEDVLVLDIEKKSIKEHIKFEKGAIAFITKGKHIGRTAVIEDIRTYEGSKADKVILKSKDVTFETARDYVFVVGKNNPVINLEK